MKVIGVTPVLREHAGRERFIVGRSVMQMLSKAGMAVVVTPESSPEELVCILDLLVISGGYDLPEDFVHHRYFSHQSPEHPVRISWERRLIDLFVASGKPILGICYGMQLINLHFGGSLYPQIESRGVDHGIGRPGAAVGSHPVDISGSRYLSAGKLTVSSSHRQGVRNVASDLSPVAFSKDGLIEAIEAPGILGVQWHPEVDSSGDIIVERFIGKVLSE